MRDHRFNFGLEEQWKEKLSPNHCEYLKNLHQESYECIGTILEMLEGDDWESKVTRFPICVETHPFAQMPMRKYTMASDAEFLQMKQQNPDIIVRKLTEEEMMHLTKQEEMQ